MDHVRRLLRRLRLLLRREAVEQAMDAEIRPSPRQRDRDLRRQGLPPESARRQALAAFGGVEPVKEAARDARGTRLVEDFTGDLPYGWRLLRRTPSVTVSLDLHVRARHRHCDDHLQRRATAFCCAPCRTRAPTDLSPCLNTTRSTATISNVVLARQLRRVAGARAQLQRMGGADAKPGDGDRSRRA